LLQSALVFYQEFLNQESDDPRIRGELAATYFRVAQITSESGSGEWLEPSRKAVEIVERLVQEGSDIRDHPSFMAGVYEQPGTGTAAKDHLAVIPVYEKGRAIWEKFVEQNPTSVGLRQDLAACYWQLGIEFLFTGQLNESLRYNILARDRWEILVDETNLPKYRRMLAATRESTARTYLKLQRFEEAEAELKKAIALQEGLLTDFPSVPSYKSTLAMALNGLAIVLQRRNRE
jgi:tetratricopeptide (TPR) repeat protein